jgi:hypothetical protein
MASESSQQQPGKLRLTGAVALGSERICLTATRGDPDEFAPPTLLLTYDRNAVQPWTAREIPRWITSLERWVDERGDMVTATLAPNGTVEIGSAPGPMIVETIPRGMPERPGKTYGEVTALRRIGTSLWACGASGQVYRRTESGAWIHADAGLLQVGETAFDNQRIGGDLAGTSEQDIYHTVGKFGPDGLTGNLFHFDGNSWIYLSTPTDAVLSAILVESPDRIWICGDGVVLFGNRRAGFQMLSTAPSPHVFNSLALHQDTLWLGSNFGLCRYDPSRNRFVNAHTGVDRKLSWVHTLTKSDGVLWCVGPDGMLRHDGRSWTRIDLPDPLPTY